MIVRGEVKRENGMYIYESDAEVIDELKKENKNLKEQLSVVSNPKLEEELNEAKIQWEYWEKECKRYSKLINLVIRTVYGKVKPLL